MKVVLGTMLTLLLASMLAFALPVQPAKASGTIYIRADGSIDPPTATIQRVEATYTLTDDIAGSLVVERHNTVIDGAGHTLQGTRVWESIGIDLTGRTNVTVRNTRIRDHWYGVMLQSSSNNSISENTVTDCPGGAGIYLLSSSYNSISGNEMVKNGIFLHSASLSSPSNFNRISGNKLYSAGIGLIYAHNNSVTGNTLNGGGISLSSPASFNNVSGNNITNDYWGIGIDTSGPNAISPKFNIISGNIITNGYSGITLDTYVYKDLEFLECPCNNSIIGNTLANNEYGISLKYFISYNTFYHNNLIGNNCSICVWTPGEGFGNFWDNGCEGNYWSDYKGTDIDGDGVGNTPYFIDGNNSDPCPLMNPFFEGDVDHDAAVDIYDIILPAFAYGSAPSDVSWNPHADVVQDNVIDIQDLLLVVVNFGKTWTP